MTQLSKIVQLGGVPHDTPILGNNFQSAAKKEQFQLEIYEKIYMYISKQIGLIQNIQQVQE